jgi:hypothetical protein
MQSDHVLEVQFCHGFKGSYIRNNKSKNKKHMRCFPQCNTAGHTTKGFCGQGVRIKVASELLDSEQIKERLTSFGGLRCMCNLDQRLCVAGQVYSQSAIKSLVDDHNLIQGSPVAFRGKFSSVYDFRPAGITWS